MLWYCFITQGLQNIPVLTAYFNFIGGFILGDSAYPLEKNCIVPFKDNGHLTNIQKKFNNRHSQTRVIIENTIGKLKKTFPILNFVNLRDVETICDIIISCCVLFNWSHDPLDSEMDSIISIEDIEHDPREIPNNGNEVPDSLLGTEIRNAIALQFQLE